MSSQNRFKQLKEIEWSGNQYRSLFSLHTGGPSYPSWAFIKNARVYLEGHFERHEWQDREIINIRVHRPLYTDCQTLFPCICV